MLLEHHNYGGDMPTIGKMTVNIRNGAPPSGAMERRHRDRRLRVYTADTERLAISGTEWHRDAGIPEAPEIGSTEGAIHALPCRPRATHVIGSKYEHLVAAALISAQEFELAVGLARYKNTDVEETLITEFQIEQSALGGALAKYFGVPYQPYQMERIKPVELLKNLKRNYVEHNQWLPVEETGEGLVVLCLDPERVKSSRIVNNVYPRSKPVYRVTTRREFKQTVDQMFGVTGFADETSVDDLLADMGEGDEAILSSTDEVSAAADNELVRLVNKIIVDAHQQGASDIHIEPGIGKDKVQIRLRLDGSLQKYIDIPASYRNAIVARIKIMCDLDISEKRKPQDGKIKFKKHSPLDIELRVATIPSAGGVEDIVMRILTAGEPIPLDSLGVLPGNLEILKTCVSKPYGLFFVCGPTGSGKTTTLHSVLKFLNTPNTKIWTAEDPVEITQKGLRQVQINKKAGLDFAAIMKAFLRADPDIIMVGEMRDAETTRIGIEASLTGHLVFATLHTNSAPESIIRLLDMGMDPFNFADALLGILAQRLAKRLCKCKEAYTPDADEIRLFMREYCSELANTESFKRDPDGAQEAVRQRLLKSYGKDGQFLLYRPKGCTACGNTGRRAARPAAIPAIRGVPACTS